MTTGCTIVIFKQLTLQEKNLKNVRSDNLGIFFYLDVVAETF